MNQNQQVLNFSPRTKILWRFIYELFQHQQIMLSAE